MPICSDMRAEVIDLTGLSRNKDKDQPMSRSFSFCGLIGAYCYFIVTRSILSDKYANLLKPHMKNYGANRHSAFYIKCLTCNRQL